MRFEALDGSAMESIARKYLSQLQDRAAVMGIQLQFPEELPRQLAVQCQGKEGARQLRRLVQERIEGPLASFLLRCSRRPGKIKARVENEEVCFQS